MGVLSSSDVEFSLNKWTLSSLLFTYGCRRYIGFNDVTPDLTDFDTSDLRFIIYLQWAKGKFIWLFFLLHYRSIILSAKTHLVHVCENQYDTSKYTVTSASWVRILSQYLTLLYDRLHLWLQTNKSTDQQTTTLIIENTHIMLLLCVQCISIFAC